MANLSSAAFDEALSAVPLVGKRMPVSKVTLMASRPLVSVTVSTSAPSMAASSAFCFSILRPMSAPAVAPSASPTPAPIAAPLPPPASAPIPAPTAVPPPPPIRPPFNVPDIEAQPLATIAAAAHATHSKEIFLIKNRIYYRTIVSSRSGPTEIIATGMPVSRSIYST